MNILCINKQQPLGIQQYRLFQVMLARNQEIRQDKENKIKLLLSEFQLCKQKIFQHKQERREEEEMGYESRKPKSVARTPSHHVTSTRRNVEKEQADSNLMRKRMEKLEIQLKQSVSMAEYREQEYQQLLRQEKYRSQRLEDQLQALTGKIQEQIYQQFEGQLQRINIEDRVVERLEHYDQKLRCLNELIQEIRKGYKLSEAEARTQIEELVAEKLELELECEQYKEKVEMIEAEGGDKEIERLQGEIQDLREDNRLKDMSIQNLQKEFREEIKQYMRRIDDIGKNKSKEHQIQLIRLQYQNELKIMMEQNSDYQSQLLQYKSRLQTAEGEIYSNQLNHQKEIEKMHLEIKKLNQNMVQLEDEHGKKCQEFDELNSVYGSVQKLLEKSQSKSQQLSDFNQELEGKLAVMNSEMVRLKEETKKRSVSAEKSGEKIQQSTLEKQIYNLKKEVDGYRNEISELRIVLESTNEELAELKKNEGKNKPNNIETPPPKGQRKDDLQREVDELKQRNVDLEMKILEYKQQLQDARKEAHKSKQREIGSQRQIQQKEQMIEQLRQKKIGFQNLFIEMEKSNERLNSLNGGNNQSETVEEKRETKEENRQLKAMAATKPSLKNGDQSMSKTVSKERRNQRVENHIKSSIKDLDIRLIDSDPEEIESLEEKLSEIKEVEFKNEEDKGEGESKAEDEGDKEKEKGTQKERKFNPYMHHSFDAVDKQKLSLQGKIKQLQSQIQLLKSQNQSLSKKKERFQEEMIELQDRQQYFIRQKEIMKMELATYATSINSLKQMAIKLLKFMVIQSKSAIKESFDAIRKTILGLAGLVRQGSQLEKQLGDVMDRKKGFFSIL